MRLTLVYSKEKGQKRDDEKRQAEAISIPRTLDRRRNVGKCMCYRMSQGTKRQRKNEAEIRGYPGESSLRWPASGGALADCALQNTVVKHGRQRPLGYVTSVR